jgi:hypothetical protein
VPSDVALKGIDVSTYASYHYVLVILIVAEQLLARIWLAPHAYYEISP